jgi:hypothetical protein
MPELRRAIHAAILGLLVGEFLARSARRRA